MTTTNLSQVCVNHHNWVPLTSSIITINDLIEHLALAPNQLAIAVNNQIINKKNWGQHRLKPNDQLSVFGAIAGG